MKRTKKIKIKNLRLKPWMIPIIILVIFLTVFLFDGLTKEGKFPFQSTQNQRENSKVYQLPEEMTGFVECLEEAGFTIYGANWCGQTKILVNELGGWETVKPIYVECTEEQEMCEEKGILGYPTIFVDEDEYQGSRTLDGFARATGCKVISNT